MITAVALAKRMKVNVRKVNEWCENGDLPAINVASDPKTRKQYRIDERDVEAFERKRSVASTPETSRRASQVIRRRPLAIKQYV